MPPPKIVVDTNIARVPFCSPHSIVIDFLLNTNNASKVSAVVYSKNIEARYSEIYPLFNELINNTNCNKKKIGLEPPLQVMVLNCVN